MTLDEFVRLSSLASKGHPDRILSFGWWLHEHGGLDEFSGAQVAKCYAEADLDPPSNFSPYLKRLTESKPPKLLKSGAMYRLERTTRDQLDAAYAHRPSTVSVRHLLAGLSGKLAPGAEQTFLDEAIACFGAGAFRASIVMTWNLAFDHLCHWIIRNHLTQFNLQLPRTAPKARIAVVSTRDDFAEIKESEVVQTCKSAGLISDNLAKILREKLDRRNMAAHPSTVVMTGLQAEDFITDLVNNIVLKLA